jgi:hypothetical protein
VCPLVTAERARANVEAADTWSPHAVLQTKGAKAKWMDEDHLRLLVQNISATRTEQLRYFPKRGVINSVQ